MFKNTEAYTNTVLEYSDASVLVLDAMRASGADYLYCVRIAGDKAGKRLVLWRTPRGEWRDDVEPELAESIIEYACAHMRRLGAASALEQFDERADEYCEATRTHARDFLERIYTQIEQSDQQ